MCLDGKKYNILWTIQKSFRNLIKLNQYQIVFTIFRLIWNQTDVRMIPNQSVHGKYNPISVWSGCNACLPSPRVLSQHVQREGTRVLSPPRRQWHWGVRATAGSRDPSHHGNGTIVTMVKDPPQLRRRFIKKRYNFIEKNINKHLMNR